MIDSEKGKRSSTAEISLDSKMKFSKKEKGKLLLFIFTDAIVSYVSEIDRNTYVMRILPWFEYKDTKRCELYGW